MKEEDKTMVCGEKLDVCNSVEFSCCTVVPSLHNNGIRFYLKGKHTGILMDFTEDALDRLFDVILYTYRRKKK